MRNKFVNSNATMKTGIKNGNVLDERKGHTPPPRNYPPTPTKRNSNNTKKA